METVNEGWLISKGFVNVGSGTWNFNGTYVHMNTTPIKATRHGITYMPSNINEMKVIMAKQSTPGCSSC